MTCRNIPGADLGYPQPSLITLHSVTDHWSLLIMNILSFFSGPGGVRSLVLIRSAIVWYQAQAIGHRAGSTRGQSKLHLDSAISQILSRDQGQRLKISNHCLVFGPKTWDLSCSGDLGPQYIQPRPKIIENSNFERFSHEIMASSPLAVLNYPKIHGFIWNDPTSKHKR